MKRVRNLCEDLGKECSGWRVVLRNSRKFQVAEAGWMSRTCLGRVRPSCRVLEAMVKVWGFVSSVTGRCWRDLAGEWSRLPWGKPWASFIFSFSGAISFLALKQGNCFSRFHSFPPPLCSLWWQALFGHSQQQKKIPPPSLCASRLMSRHEIWGSLIGHISFPSDNMGNV